MGDRVQAGLRSGGHRLVLGCSRSLLPELGLKVKDSQLVVKDSDWTRWVTKWNLSFSHISAMVDQLD